MHDTEAPDAPLSFGISNIPVALAGRGAKIIDLITDRSSTNRRFFSIEVSPRNNLRLDYNIFDDLPLFTAVTWLGNENVRQDTDSLEKAPAIKMGLAARPSTPILQHITCHNLNEKHVDELLSLNVKNVLALTGDNFRPQQSFKNAADLVQCLRRKGGPDITIAVAGYPNVHPMAENGVIDLQSLKEKVDAGADLIVTQILFSSQVFREFVINCRANGITVPIVPGVCLPRSLKQLQTILKLTGLEPVLDYTNMHNDDLKFQTKMLEATVTLVQQLFETTKVVGVHFFTLNNLDLLGELLGRLQQLGIQF